MTKPKVMFSKSIPDAIILICTGMFAGVTALPLNIYVFKNFPNYDSAVLTYAFIGVVGIILSLLFKRFGWKIKITKQEGSE